MKLTDEQLIKALTADKTLTKKIIAENVAAAETNKSSLYNQLTANGAIEKDKLNELIAKFFKVNYANLDAMSVDPAILNLIPEVMAKENCVAVFGQDEKGIHIAMNDPSDDKFIHNFSKRVEHEVIPYFSDEDSINKLHKHYAATTDANFDSLAKLMSNVSLNNTDIKKAEDLPIIKIVDKLLELAYTNKTSDIHIEPFETKTDVRFRIDGILHDIVTIPKNLHDLIVTRIKILSRLRTDEHRAAQDGRLSFNVETQKIDVRVSIVPVIYGEKVVMRLLTEHARQYDLENLGFQPNDLEKIRNGIKKPWGMILVTGPTGCGKTTTLYSFIKILNTKEVNISTIEDPVEYDIEGINQIQVNAKTGLTFSKGLRAIVRQDPDIIMVGEIRDEETASIAVNSALTGHLVLSTLHTNDSATTLPRLLDMKVKSFLVASTINIAIAQRLVRKVCSKCAYKKTMPPETIDLCKKLLSPEIIKKFGLDNANLELTYGKGCPECQTTGYKGRQGIFEVLEMNEEIKKLVMAEANASMIRDKAISMGMTTMIEDGLKKMIDGITTIDEILRVTRE